MVFALKYMFQNQFLLYNLFIFKKIKVAGKRVIQLSNLILFDPLFQGFFIILISISKKHICSCHTQLLDCRNFIIIITATSQEHILGICCRFFLVWFFPFCFRFYLVQFLLLSYKYCRICEVKYTKTLTPNQNHRLSSRG